jgi:hypothetical protein
MSAERRYGIGVTGLRENPIVCMHFYHGFGYAHFRKMILSIIRDQADLT